MSFLSDMASQSPSPIPPANGKAVTTVGTDNIYQHLIARRPTLLDEKLKLHARIIDEFNLALLEKLPSTELARQVRAYVAKYVQAEKISLNQRELEIFSNEIIDEMTGYGPLEPLL